MQIGVTGGTGFIGSRLVDFLLKSGHKPDCLIRKTSNLRWIADSGARFTEGELTDRESLRRFVRGKDLLFHLAGRIKGTREELFAANSRGTENLLSAVEEETPPLQRFLFVSTQETLGIVEGAAPAGEKTPIRPITAYGQSKADAERIVKARSGNLSWTIIRPSTVFGPRDPELFLFFKLVSRGWVLSPKVDAKISVMFCDNLIPALYAAATSEACSGKVYHIADDETVTWESFGQMIAESMEKKTRRLALPKGVLKCIGAVSSVYSAVTKNPATLNREKLQMMMQPNLMISNERAKQDFNFAPKVPLRQGIRETVEWYRGAGWLP